MSEAPRSRVALLGEGRLHAAAAARLAPAFELTATAAGGGCAALAVLSDGWESGRNEEIAASCRVAGTPWLPVHTELDRAIVGPSVVPGSPGCPRCADLRRTAARDDAGRRAGLLEHHGARLARRPSSLLTAFAVECVATLAAEEVTRLALGCPESRTSRALLVIRLDDLSLGVHRFLPHPRCPWCGSLPDDDALRAAIVLRSRPKPAPDAYRLDELHELEARLPAGVVDAEVGIVREVRPMESFGLPIAFAPVGWPEGGRADNGVGRTHDHRSSGSGAVLEALERYAGRLPGGRRTAVRAPFRSVRDDALDPRSLGLYPADRYALPGFPYAPFDEDLELGWVWGHSFARGRPVLVPECTAYYGRARSRDGGPALAFETSNGCAVGGCAEEAILFGLLEVAERDAFLVTWYARLPAAPLAIGSARDRSLALTVARTERLSGYEIRAFDMSVEQRIPAVMVMAVDARPGPGRPAAVCAAGAHLDAERACASAIGELVPLIATLPARYAADADRARAMVRDPDEVRVMDDHALLYGDPAAFERFDFLPARSEARTFAEAFADPARHADLRDDVQDLVGRYAAAGLDVIVVDQTTPELRAAGLVCVKVIVPGTLPMTFGHRARRTHGLSRLFTVPHVLGHRAAPLGPGDVNPHPHPFP